MKNCITLLGPKFSLLNSKNQIRKINYDNELFTMEKLDKYCSMLNWKMIALSILHKTRVFADSLYNTSKYKLNIINLMNTVITIAQDQDQYHKNMSNRLLRILTKELIILLEII